MSVDILESSRCPVGRLAFIKQTNTALKGFDVSSGVKAVHACMHDCIASKLLFCRSIEYDPQTNECFLSDEESHTSDRIITERTITTDLYEPVCLDGWLKHI